MDNGNGGYILTEIWKARPAWLELSAKERQGFFEDKVLPLIGSMIQNGAEVLACAINDNTGEERIDYTYSAVWRFPNKSMSDTLEAAAKAVGFLNYFEQVNFSGPSISPQQLNDHMINL